VIGDGAAAADAPAAAPMVLFQHEGKIFQVPADQWKPVYDEFAAQCKAEHDEVVELGGLHILGTERHEARRIDNQLRGRAGRQGDPGSSRFFLSLEDDLMRIFGGERVKALMFRLGMTEGVPIESGLISRRIENSQKTVEAQNFDARKHLLEYDDVMNKQRETIYGIRRSALEGKDQRDYVLSVAEEVARELVETFCPREQHPDQWNTTQFLAETNAQFGVDVKAAGADPATLAHDELANTTVEAIKNRYEEKEKQFGADLMRWLERRIILDIVDTQWKDHLLTLDHLKEGIGLRGYGQKDPLIEYKKESFELFQDMMDRIEDETIRYLFFLQVTTGGPPGEAGNGGGPGGLPERPKPVLPFSEEDEEDDEDQDNEEALVAAASSEERRTAQSAVENFTRNIQRKKDKEMAELQFAGGDGSASEKKQAVSAKKAGRNDPCPCGSGKKYKKCHGA
jgi:preprotein translocase subunit SecA